MEINTLQKTFLHPKRVCLLTATLINLVKNNQAALTWRLSLRESTTGKFVFPPSGCLNSSHSTTCCQISGSETAVCTPTSLVFATCQACAPDAPNTHFYFSLTLLCFVFLCVLVVLPECPLARERNAPPVKNLPSSRRCSFSGELSR